MRGYRHTPLASLSDESAGNTVTLVAPTKTFNIAGLGGALALIANPETRKKFAAVHHAVAGIAPNAIAVAAAEAAWTSGDRWLDEVLEYIGGNYELVKSFLAERLPRIGVFPLEGTYLALLDMRDLGLDDAPLKDRLLREARVWFDEGTKFGHGGERTQRMNLACPRSVLRDVLERLERTFD
jgi:cystathionine beta-lyase